MREKVNVKTNKWLLPLSWIYGIIIFFRNKFYDWGWFSSEEFDIPVICIGNITVGGTGKTPHTEYLIRLLKDKKRVAVLSRGYGRKTSGFILSDNGDTARTLGDEPYQIKKKFPEIIVAVDEKRRRGIHRLLKMDNPPEVILLDDAFQHRAVKPSYTVILSDYNRPMYKDKLLPVGRLREPSRNAHRANDIIVTKCPNDLQPIDFRILRHEMDAFPYQGVYYSQIVYKRLHPVFSQQESPIQDLEHLKGKTVLLVTGIASPQMIESELNNYTSKIEKLTYPDHYSFRKSDIQNIIDKFSSLTTDDKVIITTEKDATRLMLFGEMISDELKDNFFYLPIQVDFIESEENLQFNEKILNHVRDYTRDRAILKK